MKFLNLVNSIEEEGYVFSIVRFILKTGLQALLYGCSVILDSYFHFTFDDIHVNV